MLELTDALLFYVHENFNSLTPSWLVQPEVFIRFWYVQSAGCTSQDGVIDDESLVKMRTNTCLSYASAIPSCSVTQW